MPPKFSKTKKPGFVAKASPVMRKRFCKLFKVVRILRIKVFRQGVRIRVLKARMSSIAHQATVAYEADETNKGADNAYITEMKDGIPTDSEED